MPGMIIAEGNASVKEALPQQVTEEIIEEDDCEWGDEEGNTENKDPETAANI